MTEEENDRGRESSQQQSAAMPCDIQSKYTSSFEVFDILTTRVSSLYSVQVQKRYQHFIHSLHLPNKVNFRMFSHLHIDHIMLTTLQIQKQRRGTFHFLSELNGLFLLSLSLHLNGNIYQFKEKKKPSNSFDARLGKSYGSFFLNGVNEEETAIKRSDPQDKSKKDIRIYFFHGTKP